MLDDKSFPLKCDQTLEALHRSLMAVSEQHDFESDMNNGVLIVEFDDPPTKFVVSPNSPVHQIWVSAHLKSFKFEWNPERETFILPGTGEDLKAMIGRAISEQLGEQIVLS